MVRHLLNLNNKGYIYTRYNGLNIQIMYHIKLANKQRIYGGSANLSQDIFQDELSRKINITWLTLAGSACVHCTESKEVS